MFVELGTTGGLRGLGEATMSADDAMTIRLCQEYFDAVLAGADLDAFGSLIDRLKANIGDRPPSCPATAMSALEQAMWDIRGQQLRVPIHSLLGGKRRPAIPLYANINRGLIDRSPDAFGARAAEAVAAGFRAIKCAPFDGLMPGSAEWPNGKTLRDRGIARVAAVREAIGPSADLMVDCHGRFDFDEALCVADALRPLGLRWFEEPIPTSADFHAYAHITSEGPVGKHTSDSRFGELAQFKDRCDLRLAGGEFFFGLRQFTELLDERGLDVVMPDVKHCGGLFETIRAATLAEAYEVGVAPHNPSGPISTIGSGHVACVLPRFDILEYQWGDVPWRKELVSPPECIERGELLVPDLPGLGVTLNEDLVSEYSIPIDAEVATA